MTTDSNNSKEFKVTFIGEKATGKTTLLRYLNNKVDNPKKEHIATTGITREEYIATTGISIYSKKIVNINNNKDEKIINHKLQDIGGTNQVNKRFLPTYYRHTDLFVICIDTQNITEEDPPEYTFLDTIGAFTVKNYVSYLKKHRQLGLIEEQKKPILILGTRFDGIAKNNAGKIYEFLNSLQTEINNALNISSPVEDQVKKTEVIVCSTKNDKEKTIGKLNKITIENVFEKIHDACMSHSHKALVPSFSTTTSATTNNDSTPDNKETPKPPSSNSSTTFEYSSSNFFSRGFTDTQNFAKERPWRFAAYMLLLASGTAAGTVTLIIAVALVYLSTKFSSVRSTSSANSTPMPSSPKSTHATKFSHITLTTTSSAMFTRPHAAANAVQTQQQTSVSPSETTNNSVK